ncbi:hypothetical protein [Mesorhizobium onobrychidis]|uniref:Uncharacterized protein n=1 Tax=Mesorhizobium onobrychidis TaxID=2775404 RepID=A0ABY5R719_9HYPH|nr:hypothetical protein [Mesorhizobium onobrychidis]UVC18626.1 hypothetical protein IHQ72_17065 [Mesorhizobium onobrychidis]
MTKSRTAGSVVRHFRDWTCPSALSYWPDEAILDGTWKRPVIKVVK